MEVTDFYVRVGRAIARALEASGTSQTEVAQWFGVTRQTVNKWVMGEKIPLHTLVELARRLGVSADSLVGTEMSRQGLTPHERASVELIDLIREHGPEEVVRRLSSTPDHIPDVSKMVQPLEEQHLQAVPIPGLPGGDLEEQPVVGPMREEPTKPRQGKRGSRKGTG